MEFIVVWYFSSGITIAFFRGQWVIHDGMLLLYALCAVWESAVRKGH